MKTIEEAAREIFPNPDPNQITAFELGVEFAQRWIPVEEEKPNNITHKVKQLNGNTLFFYENYLVKGYYVNEAKTKESLVATWIQCSVYWYFSVYKSPNTIDFIVTHWRPIELI